MASWIQDALHLLRQSKSRNSPSKVCQEQCNILRGTLGDVYNLLERVQDVAVDDAAAAHGKEQNLVTVGEDVKCNISIGLKLITSYDSKDEWVITALLSEEGREDFKDVHSELYDSIELASGFMLEVCSSDRDKWRICEAYSTFLMKKTSVSMLELAAVNDRKQMMRMGLSSECAEEDPALQLLCTMLLEKNAPLLDRNQLEFKQHLKQGGYGTVYEACWLDKVDVAVKVFSSGDSSFRRELAALASCKHPNILRIVGYAYDSDKQQHSLVMERMDMDLGDMITKAAGKFSLLESIYILSEIAKGMAWLHSKDVIHRDLKPQNILVVSRDGVTYCRIADFGLSRTNFATSKVSFATSKLGTRIYMAPEVWGSQHYSKKSDVFSFAMICYQLLTGRSPFQGELEGNDYILRVCNGMRPLDVFPENCPVELAELTRQCWSGDVTERPSFAEIHERLKLVKAKIITDALDWNEVRKKLLASSSANSSSFAAAPGRVNQNHSKTRVNTDSLYKRSQTGAPNNTSSTFPMRTNNGGASHKQSSTYPQATTASSNKDELMKLVRRGRMADAFEKALSLKDPDTLWWLASKVDSSLLNTFEERMVYSVTEQLSEVVGSDPVAVVTWMAKAIELLSNNTRDGSARLVRLLGRVAQGLHGVIAVTPKDSELTRFLMKNLKSTNETLKRFEDRIRIFGTSEDSDSDSY